jgi:hypothetical protein
MTVSIYVEGSKYHYTADSIEIVDVNWSKEEVIKLVNPKECYDNGPYEDADECIIQGDILIPKNKITHLICWT